MSSPSDPSEPTSAPVALVSGGGGAIGRAIGASLGARGTRVVSLDVTNAAAGGAGEGTPESDAAGPDSVVCDVADPGAVNATVESVAAKYGRIDHLVHAAGITRDRVLWKMTAEEWRDVLRVNLDSAFHLLHACAPYLRRSPSGAVVLISSINGERGKFGQANYAASKAGLVGLARSAARELGRDGVRVNVVAPGWIETRMTASLPEGVRTAAMAESALGRFGSPEDVAASVAFLCLDARHVTGQVLRVDGGQLMG